MSRSTAAGPATSFRHTVCAVGGACFDDPCDFDGWALGGAGRGNAWVGPAMSVQLDVQARRHLLQDTNIPSSAVAHFAAHSYLIGGHANWRNSQTGLLGVFAGAGDAGGGFGEALRPARRRRRRGAILLGCSSPSTSRAATTPWRAAGERSSECARLVCARHRPILRAAQHDAGRHGALRQRRDQIRQWLRPGQRPHQSASRPGCGKRSSSTASPPRPSRRS